MTPGNARLRRKPVPMGPSAPAALGALGALVMLILACDPFGHSGRPDYAGPCTETGNPTGIQGKASLPDGKPAAGAWIGLFLEAGADNDATAAQVGAVRSCAD